MAYPFSHNWWLDTMDDNSYSYARPDELYTREYFNSEHHPSEDVAENLYSYMQQTYKQLFGKYFASVIEFGGGGGELTLQFQEDNLQFLVVEPSSFGVEKLLNKGIEHWRIYKSDIRFLQQPSLRYDLVVCTEVAEHIEPWFASKVVEACTSRSNAVWWSAASIRMNPHYHHPNVAPNWAWDNIFYEFGFRDFVELDGRHDRADRLYYRA